MNIKDPTDYEKSAMLAKIRGWHVTRGKFTTTIRKHADGTPLLRFLDSSDGLYDPINMALAFELHLWRLSQEDHNDPEDMPYHIWWDYNVIWMGKNAQRLWLDKILELAIEAELVELEEETDR